MATNPMQRKSRNSFLLGMVITLLITGAIIAFLIVQLTSIKKKEQEEKLSYVTVYVLKKDIKSGGEISVSDLETTQVVKTKAPADYLTPSDLGEKNAAKISMTSGTVLSKQMIYKDEESIENDVRKQEYNMIVLPMELQTGDYVDIRIAFPSGTDYIVVSKKQVEIPFVGNTDSVDTAYVNLSETEILSMSNAIVEAYQVKGSKIYMTKYTEPGVQEAAKTTYPVKSEVLALINSNPNIVQEAKSALWSRYNTEQRNEVINREVNSSGTQGRSNIESGVDTSVTNSKTTRKEYLDGMSANVVQ